MVVKRKFPKSTLNCVENKILELTKNVEEEECFNQIDENCEPEEYDAELVSYRFPYFIQDNLVKNWPPIIMYCECQGAGFEDVEHHKSCSRSDSDEKDKFELETEELDCENISFFTKGDDYVIYEIHGDWQPIHMVKIVLSSDSNYVFEIIDCKMEKSTDRNSLL